MGVDLIEEGGTRFIKEKKKSLTKTGFDLMEWIRKAFKGERELLTVIQKPEPSLDIR